MSYHYLNGIELSAKLRTKVYFGLFWSLIYLFDRNRFIEKQNEFFMEIWRKDKDNILIKPLIRTKEVKGVVLK